MKRTRILTLALAAIPLLAPAAQPAAAACVPLLCYVDLGAGGGQICHPAAYTFGPSNPADQTIANPDCTGTPARSAVVEVRVPSDCTGVAVWVEYDGEPKGWTVNVGDSPTNNGFGGDSGTPPTGQNAEVQILENTLSLYSAADNPDDVKQLALQHLALQDGSIRFEVKDQSVSWGQPYSAVATPDERLFFLPANPAAPENRTLYVGLNRVVAPVTGRAGRDGCGARRALLILQ